MKIDKIFKNIKDFFGRTQVKKVLCVAAMVLTVLFVALAVLINRSVFWTLNTWSNLSMEEIIYHLNAPLEGTNSSMIVNYICACVIITVLLAIALSVLLFRIRKNKKHLYIVMLGSVAGAIVLGTCSIGYIWSELDVSSYLSNNKTYSSFIDENYVDPASVSLTFPEKKRNLIYIYLESMEGTYADEENGGAFKENVIPELTKLSEDNQNFSGSENVLNGGHALTGATWTMAAIFGQSTGLPLLIPIDINGMNTQNEFMPGVTSIGDILENAGYRQMFLAGSDATFGGRRLFLEQHGNYEISDYYTAIETGKIPEDYHVWWGYEDAKLFEYAKEHLKDLSSSAQPFNLTMLTVDTHFEDGYVCEECPDVYDDQYSNVMRCSSQQVSEFVSWIQQQDFYENTTIVISGDHPTMDSDYCQNISTTYERKVYTTYINAPLEPENREYRDYSTFDNFPTTLASLGVEISGNRLGLGTNLYSSLPTLTEEYGYQKANAEISKKSEVMDRLTSYIQAVDGQVESQGYDETTGMITVTLKGLSWNYPLSGAKAAVWFEDQTQNMRWYQADQIGEDDYSVSIPISDFDNQQGKYNIHYYAIAESEATPLFVSGVSERVGSVSSDMTGPIGTVITADVATTPYDYHVGTFSISISNLVTNTDIQSVRCAVWSEEDQSDMTWYEAELQPDGSYIAYVRASDFAFKETTYNIHAYAIDASGSQNYIGETIGVIN